jgi:hypothetical protein
VTRKARRGLSANEIACALISMMARSTTRSNQKAGYIDARPLTAGSAKATCNARPDHTLGHLLQKRNVGDTSAFPLISDHIADAPTRRKSAMKRLMHRSNYLLYSIT